MATPSEISIRVLDFLKETSYACSTLTPLSGGTANFVYRGTLLTPLSDGSKTVVIKHTEGYSASNPGFKLERSRCDYEQAILYSLENLPPVIENGITITTPKLHLFNAETNTQIYSDLPASTELKTYILSHPLTRPQAQRLGTALGKWTRTFHDWGASEGQRSLKEVMKGNTAMTELKFMINYDTLLATVEKFEGVLGESRGVFEEVRRRRRDELDGTEGELIHGDFWSGNVLLPNSPFPSSDEAVKLLIIDWELSHLSSLAFDLGQMFAELFELKHFKDLDAGVWLVKSFMEGYGKIDEELAFKAAIHAGTHLICWGSRVQGWGTTEQVEDVVRVGRDWIIKGWEGDVGYFGNTPLACLFA